MVPAGFSFRLYLVTDQKACLGRDFFWVLEEAIKGGVDLVQLREKELSIEAFIQKALRCKEICERYNVPLIINDQPLVAKAVQARGLHIGQTDEKMNDVLKIVGKDFPVGLSLDEEKNLYLPYVAEAWYYGISPIFLTPTKQDTLGEWGLEGLKKIRELTGKPLVAIGNIKPDNAAAVISHGADCVAVVSGICSAPIPGKAAENYLKEIDNAKR